MPIIGSIVDETTILYKYYENDYNGRVIFGRIDSRTRSYIRVKYWYVNRPTELLTHDCPNNVFQRIWLPVGKVLNRRSFD